jgi:hypothetical protein
MTGCWGRIAESIWAGSSRSLRKRVAALRWGTVSVVAVSPSGTVTGSAKAGSLETDCSRKRSLPVMMQG